MLFMLVVALFSQRMERVLLSREAENFNITSTLGKVRVESFMSANFSTNLCELQTINGEYLHLRVEWKLKENVSVTRIVEKGEAAAFYYRRLKILDYFKRESFSALELQIWKMVKKITRLWNYFESWWFNHKIIWSNRSWKYSKIVSYDSEGLQHSYRLLSFELNHKILLKINTWIYDETFMAFCDLFHATKNHLV